MSDLPIFDEWIGSDPAFATSVGLARRLGLADQLGLQLNVPVGATAPTVASVTMFYSQDGRNFVARSTMGPVTDESPAPQINPSSFTLNKVNVFTWSEAWPAPPVQKYVQIQVSYAGPPMRITLYANWRERRIRARSYDPPCDGCAEAAEHPGYMRVLHAMAPHELAALRDVTGARGKLAPRVAKKFDAAVNAAALQVLAGSE